MSWKPSEVALVPGVSFRLDVPDDARVATAPAPEIGSLPGVELVVAQTYDGHDVSVRLACVTGPTDRWVPGIEELVFDRATQLARGGLVDLDHLDAASITETTGVFRQTLEGTKRSGDALRGAHALAFVGDDHRAFLCTTLCSSARVGACDAVVAKASFQGDLVGPPAPGLAARAVLFTATSPRLAASLALTMAVLVCALILKRRPRPRP